MNADGIKKASFPIEYLEEGLRLLGKGYDYIKTMYEDNYFINVTFKDDEVNDDEAKF